MTSPARTPTALLILLCTGLVATAGADPVAELERLISDARRQASYAKADCRVAEQQLHTTTERLQELAALAGGFPPLDGVDDGSLATTTERAENAAADAFIIARIATDSAGGACRGALAAARGEVAGDAFERARRAPETMRRSLSQVQNRQVEVALARHQLARIAGARGAETAAPTTLDALRQAIGAAARRALDAIMTPLQRSAEARSDGEDLLAAAQEQMRIASSADDERLAVLAISLEDVRAGLAEARSCQAAVTGRYPDLRSRVTAAAPVAIAETTAGGSSADRAWTQAKQRLEVAAGRVESVVLHVATLPALSKRCATLADAAAAGTVDALQIEEIDARIARLDMPTGTGPRRLPEPGNFGECEGLYRFWQLKTGCRFDEALAVLASRTGGPACLEFGEYIAGERYHLRLLALNESLIERLLREGDERLSRGNDAAALERFIAARSFARCQTQQDAGNAGIARALSGSGS